MNDYKLAIEIKVTTTPVDSLGTPMTQDLFVETQETTSLFVGTKEEIQEMVDDAVLAISRQWMLAASGPPVINANEPSNVDYFSADASGMVDADGVSTVVTLEWGKTPLLGNILSANESPLSGSGFASVTWSLEELFHSTSYYYRIKAVSANGTAYSDLKGFTTLVNIWNPIYSVDLYLGDRAKWNDAIVAPDGNIYAPPNREVGTILEINPVTEVIREYGSYITTTNKWKSFTLAPDGKLYSVPQNISDILEFDPVTKAHQVYPGATSPVATTQKWFSSALAPNGKIYGIPGKAQDVLEFDPVTKGINLFGGFTDNVFKWNWGVLGPDGKIYAGPTAPDINAVLEIDPSGPTAVERPIDVTTGYFVRSVLVGEKLFLLPYSLDHIGIFNVYTKAYHTIDYFEGKVSEYVVTNNKIYITNRDSGRVAELDPATEEIIYFGDFSVTGFADIGGTPGVDDDGIIWQGPGYLATKFLKIDPFAKTAILTGYVDNTIGWPFSKLINTNGKVFGIPQDWNRVIKLSPTSSDMFDPPNYASPIVLKVNYDGVTQFDFKFKAPITSTLDIYDGDGTMTPVVGQDSTLITHTTSYAKAGTYYLYVEGDVLDCTYLFLDGLNFVSGDASRYYLMTNLTAVIFYNGIVYGDITKLGGVVPLFQMALRDLPLLEGDMSEFNSFGWTADNCPKLTFTKKTAFAAGVTFLRFLSLDLTTTEVDNILGSLPDFTSGRLSIIGNAARSSNSDADLLALIERNNVVSVYEEQEVGILGPELHTDANAASDPNGNEANAITGWTEDNLNGTGNNKFVSQEGEVAEGKYAFNLDANDTPTGGAGIRKTFPTDTLSKYRLEYKFLHSGIGSGWMTYVLGQYTGWFIRRYSEEFQKCVTYFPASGASEEIRFIEGTSDNDGAVYIDDLSLKKAITTPIYLQVDYDGVTQFEFKFKAPLASTLSINDGDGTVTPVAGNDATEVTHTTNYSTAGTYYFYVEGDWLDLTYIRFSAQNFVSGDISRFSALTKLDYLRCNGTNVSGDVSGFAALTLLTEININNTFVSGDISGWNVLTNLTVLGVRITNVSGDVSGFSALTNLTNLSIYGNPDISGDISGFSALTNLTFLGCLETAMVFDSVSLFAITGQVLLYDCNLTSTMVDNALQSFVNLTGCTINLGGNNASRSAASNDAMVALLVAGNTVTVNEDLRYIDTPIRLTVDFDGTTQFDFKFKAPLGSYLIMYDGDGTRTLVQGNDATLVTHTTNYATAGEYTFIVVGDPLDITMLDLQGMTFISGSVTNYSLFLNAVNIYLSGSSGLYGNIDSYGDLSNIGALAFMKLYLLTGDIGSISGTPIVGITGRDTKLTGDLAQLATTDLLNITLYGSTGITFDTIVSWTAPVLQFKLYDCLWTTEMVDNCLISLADGGFVIGALLDIGGSNAPRSEASTAALSTLLAAGNEVIVNYESSPIQLRVTYDGVTQFDFKFKLPSTKYVIIDDGDGTRTIIQGQDDVLITHSTTYTTNKVYDFYVDGDVRDITQITVRNQSISGDISGWKYLPNLIWVSANNTDLGGNISDWGNNSSFTVINVSNTNVSGSINSWGNMTLLTSLTLQDVNLTGDISNLTSCVSLEYLYIDRSNIIGDLASLEALTSLLNFGSSETATQFNSISLWSIAPGGEIDLSNCRLTSTMVDNALLSFVNLTGCTINLAGNNAPRTEASTAALMTLLLAGNTVNVNYDSPVELEVFYDAVTQFEFKFKLPSTKYVLIDDGDGTRTLIQGQDGTLITHTTAYTLSAYYKFFVDGDVFDLTQLTILPSALATGSIDRWDELVDLTIIQATVGGLYGNAQSIKDLPSLILCSLNKNIGVYGDVSQITPFSAGTYFQETSVTFDNIVTITGLVAYKASDSNWTSTMVDNCLISLANGGTTGINIDIGGNNAPRTSASDAAMVTLWENGNDVTVNEDADAAPRWRYDGVDRYHINNEADFLIAQSSGSIKARVYYDGENLTRFFMSSDILTGLYTAQFSFHSSGRVMLAFQDNTNPGSFLASTTYYTKGWHIVEMISNGSSYTIIVDGVETGFDLISGDDNGVWFADVPNRVNISIGALIDNSPNFSNGAVDWVKIDDGVNGDWVYDADTNTFIDSSVLGLDLTPVGTWP